MRIVLMLFMILPGALAAASGNSCTDNVQIQKILQSKEVRNIARSKSAGRIWKIQFLPSFAAVMATNYQIDYVGDSEICVDVTVDTYNCKVSFVHAVSCPAAN